MAKTKSTRRDRAQRQAELRRLEEAERARQRRRWRLVAVAATAAVVVVAVLVAILTAGGGASPEAGTQPSAPQATGAPKSDIGGIEEHGSVLGSPQAPYTLVEFNDLVCPGCKTYAQQILPAVIEKYVRTGKLRIEMRPFGFVRDYSTLAAQYAQAAGMQDKMWPFVLSWYANAGDENTDYVNDAFARKIAATVGGLDAGRLIRDAHLASTRRKLDDIARGFLTLNQQVVPAFAAGRTGQTIRPISLGSSGSDATAVIGQLVAGH